jgi:hypothetical protein
VIKAFRMDQKRVVKTFYKVSQKVEDDLGRLEDAEFFTRVENKKLKYKYKYSYNLRMYLS